MILYKYMSLETALKVLSSRTLRFATAASFNDPFETFAGHSEGEEFSFWRGSSRAPVLTRYRILCLTRDPLGTLMWAHYADAHKGVVLGIDCKVAGFEDEDKCVLPDQYGSIIYTKTKPTSPYQGSKIIRHSLKDTAK